MRDIRYRAWNRKHKIFYYSQNKENQILSGYQKLEIFFKIIHEYKHEFDLPDQYTRVKDKNSIDIYEGDICLFPTTRNKKIIIFKNGACGYEGLEDFIPLCEYRKRDGIEVIGNIYENPEFFTTEKWASFPHNVSSIDDRHLFDGVYAPVVRCLRHYTERMGNLMEQREWNTNGIKMQKVKNG